jgi:hypothetical protein
MTILKELGYVERTSTQPIGSSQPTQTITSGDGVNMPLVRKSHPNAPKRKIDVDNSKRRQALHANNSFGGHDTFDAPLQPLDRANSTQSTAAKMFQNAPSAFTNGDGAGPSNMRGAKRRVSLHAEDSPRGGKGKVMTSSGPRVISEVVEIRAPRRAAASSSGGGGTSRHLPLPRIQTILRTKTGDDCYIEASNAGSAKGKNKVTYVQADEDQWLDYLSSAVVVMAGNERLGAVACEDGEVIAYGIGGSR